MSFSKELSLYNSANSCKRCNSILDVVSEDSCIRGKIEHLSCKCGKKTKVDILR